MLTRFCLYGFLKNQQYFEPFLILALRQKGLSFFQIGLLVAVRQLSLNLLEIPSGAWADASGRRAAMVASMLAYIAGFVLFGTAAGPAFLALAMILLGAGDAFRTGTHKAMIMTWLELEGRPNDKTLVYGYTRSWSKLGSLLSALIAGAVVLLTRRYTAVFWLAVLPYTVNLVNLATYPAALDGDPRDRQGALRDRARRLAEGLRTAVRNRHLRFALLESMCFDGLYETTRTYLQPLLKRFALALPLLLTLPDRSRTAVVVALAYALLYASESLASRQSHRVSRRCGGEFRVAGTLWRAETLLMAALLPLFLWGAYAPLIAGFVALAVLYNLMRPTLVSRVAGHSPPELRATLLSLESQSKALFTMVAAPLLGWAVDRQGFWPIAVFGLLVCVAVLALRRRLAHLDVAASS